MLTYLLFTAFCFAAAHATGDFVILHSPDSVQFSGNEEIGQSMLKDVFSAALSLTVKQVRGTWSGMAVTDPLMLPEAVVGIAVEGVDTLDAIKGERYPLNVDEVEEITWQALSGRLAERCNDNTLVRIYLADGLDALGQSALGELKTTPIEETSLKALNPQKEDDRKFLEEVQLLHAIAKKAPSTIKQDSNQDVYWLVVSGLHGVFDLHGKNSTAAREAVVLLSNALNDINKAFIDAYNGQVVVAAFTNDATQIRHTRAASESQLKENTDVQGDQQDQNIEDEEDKNNIVSSTSENYDDSEIATERSDDSGHKEHNIKPNTQNKGKSGLNLAQSYSEDYPVIFNILLWFGVIFVFSLLAICIAIADMDPGRDSIIYRMTSNRMKKDA